MKDPTNRQNRAMSPSPLAFLRRVPYFSELAEVELARTPPGREVVLGPMTLRRAGASQFRNEGERLLANFLRLSG